MASFEEEIFSIQEYFRSIEYYGKGVIVKVEFPPRWTVYNSKDGDIKVTKSDDSDSTYFYYSEIGKNTLSEIFSLIRETIKTNLNVLKKIELMKVKIEELKTLFSEKPIEELVNLEFTFRTPKKVTRKKKVDKKIEEKQEENKETNIEENDNG